MFKPINNGALEGVHVSKTGESLAWSSIIDDRCSRGWPCLREQVVGGGGSPGGFEPPEVGGHDADAEGGPARPQRHPPVP